MAIRTREIIKCRECGREVETSEMTSTQPWTMLEISSSLLTQNAESLLGSGTYLKETFCSPNCLSFFIVCKMYEETIAPTMEKYAGEWVRELEGQRKASLDQLRQRTEEHKTTEIK